MIYHYKYFVLILSLPLFPQVPKVCSGLLAASSASHRRSTTAIPRDQATHCVPRWSPTPDARDPRTWTHARASIGDPFANRVEQPATSNITLCNCKHRLVGCSNPSHVSPRGRIQLLCRFTGELPITGCAILSYPWQLPRPCSLFQLPPTFIIIFLVRQKLRFLLFTASGSGTKIETKSTS